MHNLLRYIVHVNYEKGNPLLKDQDKCSSRLRASLKLVGDTLPVTRIK